MSDGIPTQEQLSAAVDALGDDISSLSISVDGVIYQFLMNTNDMLDAVWYFDSTGNTIDSIEFSGRL